MRNKLSDLLRNRWQIPMAMVAAGLTFVAFQRLAPKAEPIDFEVLWPRLQALHVEGRAAEAADAAANLLSATPPLRREARGKLHKFLADLLYEQSTKSSTRRAPNVERMLEHLDRAEADGVGTDAESAWRRAQALQWLDRNDAALDLLRTVVDETRGDRRRSAQRQLFTLLSEQAGARARNEALAIIQTMLADPQLSGVDRWWALQHAVSAKLEVRDYAGAQALIAENRPLLGTSDVKGYLDYLEGLSLVEQGRAMEAAPLVDSVEAWLGTVRLRDDVLDNFGHLPAMARWLRGRIHLVEQQPQAALHAFQDALAIQTGGGMYLPASLGRVEALAELERHEEAQTVLRLVSDRLTRNEASAPEWRSLRTVCDRLQSRWAEPSTLNFALKYLRQALVATPDAERAERLRLLERLGALELQASAGGDTADRSEHLRGAGEAMRAAAWLAEAGSEHRATLLWNSAQAYDAAGDGVSLRSVLNEVLALGPSDPRRPGALLQLGQSHEAIGDFDTAIRTYESLSREYPQLEEAARGQLLQAGCLLALGDDNREKAEQLLTALLENESLSPDAAVFHDALLQLADMAFQDGRFALAIGRLDSFVERYPSDAEAVRAQFCLADAYRRSALQLQATASAPAVSEARTRLREAVQRYQALQSGSLAKPKDEMQALYRQLALMGEADCLRDLDEPESRAAALGRYRQVAAEYEHTPAALTAQVEVARLHLAQGELRDAARALEQCRWLMQGITDDAFAAQADGVSRREWETYFKAITGSPLFADVFAAR